MFVFQYNFRQYVNSIILLSDLNYVQFNVLGTAGIRNKESPKNSIGEEKLAALVKLLVYISFIHF